MNEPAVHHPDWLAFVASPDEGVGIRFLACQLELAPTTLRQHLQGLVVFKNARTLRGVKSSHPFFAGAHLEPMRGTFDQARSYATKDETRLDGPWEWGEPLSQGRRSDLERVRDEVLGGKLPSDVALEEPELYIRVPRWLEVVSAESFRRKAVDAYASFIPQVDSVTSELVPAQRAKEVVVLYGPPGTGKTSGAFSSAGGQPQIFRLVIGDGTNKSVWFDGYRGEDCLLLDDFWGNLPVQFLLNLLDIYPLRVNIKGGHTWVNFSRVYITSNIPPWDWYTSGKVSPLLRAALFRRFTSVLLCEAGVPAVEQIELARDIQAQLEAQREGPSVSGPRSRWFPRR